jgi:hypothetical protein
MRVIVATFAGLVALSAASAQAAPPVPKPPDISNQEWAPLSNNPPSPPHRPLRPSSWLPKAADGAGIIATGGTVGATGTGAAAFRMAGEPRDRDARAALTQKIWSTTAS